MLIQGHCLVLFTSLVASIAIEDISRVKPWRCTTVPYELEVSVQDYRDNGEVLECRDNVTTTACSGWCYSSELSDYRMPFKISYHTVCTYAGLKKRKAFLRNCDPRHRHPYTYVYDAQGCMCKVCDRETTHCQP
ncbi:hypothetical protein CAPTEDRAFT_172959 [Capitella teleta]|uniref:Glycoprotein hormone subunit beta domain-containing protein n=1 Tax=Capitella teleta TaxID=283909 RepID=R7UQL4_CAPTE|nr:hypothetical protein CAPTEDRAFT_172959 [Capitella teleta]|eukprot:ELU06222.1 hypothetical protein CAPTEDRAFT_172959 [Capitella teleta]